MEDVAKVSDKAPPGQHTESLTGGPAAGGASTAVFKPMAGEQFARQGLEAGHDARGLDHLPTGYLVAHLEV